VQSISIKSTKSTSLPIWSCKLGTGEGARWRESALGDDESEDDDEDVVPDVPQQKTSKAKQSRDRGKKRVAV
jgi:ribosome biogenesis protein UTP30